jgi:hypothetical protein
MNCLQIPSMGIIFEDYDFLEFDLITNNASKEESFRIPCIPFMKLEVFYLEDKNKFQIKVIDRDLDTPLFNSMKRFFDSTNNKFTFRLSAIKDNKPLNDKFFFLKGTSFERTLFTGNHIDNSIELTMLFCYENFEFITEEEYKEPVVDTNPYDTILRQLEEIRKEVEKMHERNSIILDTLLKMIENNK